MQREHSLVYRHSIFNPTAMQSLQQVVLDGVLYLYLMFMGSVQRLGMPGIHHDSSLRKSFPLTGLVAAQMKY
jgi:hypothetical protein